MRKLRSIFCLACLMVLALLALQAKRVLPQDNSGLVAEKYAGWSGVLRLWTFDGWQSGGSIAGWLNRSIAGFERQHPGVYVQPQAVDAGAIASLGESGISPPDMLLFPPGLLDGADGLLPLVGAPELRPELARSGTVDGVLRAAPVAMGGYMWAWNTALIEAIPGSWRKIDAMPAVPMDDAWHCWSAALLALCAGQRSEAGPETGSGGADIDLGLAGEAATPAPTSAPNPKSAALCELPEGFAPDPDAWRRFINGEAAAVAVTQREICRLQALSDQGRGPDGRLDAGGAALSDQLLFLAVVDKPDAQRTLCQAFVGHLLSDACQGELHRAGAFSVTGAESGYPAGDPLAQMDAALRSEGLCAPGAFGSGWREAAAIAARRYIDGKGEAPRLWQDLAGRLRSGL